MLTKKESSRLVSLLKKIDNPHNGLPYDVFLQMVKTIPFVACEIIIRNKKGEFFMTWRKDELCDGWHFPGGLMRYGESFEERLQKTMQKEMNINILRFRMLHFLDYGICPRGHVIGLLFECVPDVLPNNGRFFSAMPGNIIDGHKKLWNTAEKLYQGKKLKREIGEGWTNARKKKT